MEFGSNGGADDGESIAGGGAGVDSGGSVGVADGHSATIGTITRGRCVAELVNIRHYPSQLVVARAGCRQADLSRVVCLPCSNLTAKGIILVAGGKPRDVGHVERDEARRVDHTAFVVVVPGCGRAVRPGCRNLMTAVPRRGRHLSGEVFERRALALFVVCHAVSTDSIPNPVDHCLGAGFDDFAARIGGRDVAGSFTGDGRIHLKLAASLFYPMVMEPSLQKLLRLFQPKRAILVASISRIPRRLLRRHVLTCLL